MRARVLPSLLAPLLLIACAKSGAATATATARADEAEPGPARASEELGQGMGAPVGKELPPELLAELRLQGDDADGRLVTLAPGFIATAACSDCGAPGYLWFLAVRCSEPTTCEVLTESCEGAIRRQDALYHLEFRAIEGAEAEAAALCADYSGVFESAGTP